MPVTLLAGDARAMLANLPAGQVQMVCTSPPFYNLRTYGTTPQVWGGDSSCEHDWQATVRPARHTDDGETGSTLEGSTTRQSSCQRTPIMTATCTECCAQLCELGQEATLDEYIEHLLEVFRAVRRVMHDTGLLFVNLGDAYSGSGKGRKADGTHSIPPPGSKQATNTGTTEGYLWKTVSEHPAGSLLGVPWRFAFAMQQDGWLLRSAITLVKPSGMPESMVGPKWEQHKIKVGPQKKAPEGSYKHDAFVGTKRKHGAVRHNPVTGRTEFDSRAQWERCPGCEKCLPNGGLVLDWGSGRPTSSTEMLFMFAVSGRNFFNTEGVRSQLTLETIARDGRARWTNSDRYREAGEGAHLMAANGQTAGAMRDVANMVNPAGANARNWMVWVPEPLKANHYAAFPTFLPSWCVKAGTPESVCSQCFAPYAPIIERGEPDREWQQACGGDENGEYHGQATKDYAAEGVQDASEVKRRILAGLRTRRTLDWKPTCDCNVEGRPAIVLDPFGGSGSTGMAAERLGRDAILIDLNENYVDLCEMRMKADAGLFAEVERVAPAAAAAPAQEALPFGEE